MSVGKGLPPCPMREDTGAEAVVAGTALALVAARTCDLPPPRNAIRRFGIHIQQIANRIAQLTECAAGPLLLQHRLSALDPRLRQSLLGEGLRFCGHNRALVFKTHLRRVWEVAPTD